MSLFNSNKLCILDKIRIQYGNDRLINFFDELALGDRQRAIRLINDKRLSFYTLFILLPEIENLNLYESLNQRNIVCLKKCGKILKDDSLTANINTYTDIDENTDYSVLKWMFKTGYINDGFNNEYDQILDITASVLIKKYNDISILPIIVDMIFERNKKGYFIHDLVWAFFQSRNPYTLQLIADYLLSLNKKDIELARKLLNIESNENNKKQYESYILDLRENYPFLYFTGESFQLTSKPVFFRVDLNAKYLCKKISPYAKNQELAISKREHEQLKNFSKLNVDEKILLSRYSFMIHRRNIQFWHRWMKLPINEQIDLVKRTSKGDIQ